MKKLILPLIMLAVLLSACGASKTSSPAGNGNDPAARTLPPLTQVAIGIFKLEGTDQAVTAKQASDLLPLWQVYSTLNQSDTAAQAEVDALVQQIQDSMTSDQMKAIQGLKLTQKDVFALMQEKGIITDIPQGTGTRTPSNNGSGFTQNFPGGRPEGGFQGGGGVPPEGGGIPGGNFPRSGTQTAGGQNAPQRRGLDRIPSALLELFRSASLRIEQPHRRGKKRGAFQGAHHSWKLVYS